MAVDTLQLDGMAISDVMKSIRDTGVGDSEASIILGTWLIQQGARQQRVFNYQIDFPAVETDCVETFTPTFHHTDWVDGESVVQAQQSVACNASHSVEERLSRWLLRAHDLWDGESLAMTQELLAHMLGVQRNAVL